MKEYYLQTKKLTTGYDGKPVLTDVELKIDRGQIVTLIGPNGAGKTTFLKTVIGQLEPIAGCVFLEDKNLNEIRLPDLAKQMSVLLTTPLKVDMMTVENVVEMGRYPYTGRFGLLGEEDHKIVWDIMEKVGVSQWKDRDFDKLSDGQKQRVLLARALAQQPDILILDEPTSYLDIRHKVEFLSILKNLAVKEGLTVIMSLHEVELAGCISDRVACFKDGYLDKYGDPKEIFQENYLIWLYNIHMDDVSPEFHNYILSYGK